MDFELDKGGDELVALLREEGLDDFEALLAQCCGRSALGGVCGPDDDPNDARIKLISLTSAGRQKSDEIHAFQKGIHRKILLSLDPSQRKNVLSHLELLRSSMEAVKEQLV